MNVKFHGCIMRRLPQTKALPKHCAVATHDALSVCELRRGASDTVKSLGIEDLQPLEHDRPTSL